MFTETTAKKAGRVDFIDFMIYVFCFVDDWLKIKTARSSP